MQSSLSPRKAPYLVDVAANLTDAIFRGVDWKGNRRQPDDFEEVLERARKHHVEQIIITGTSLAQSVKAIQLCRRYSDRRLLCSVGVHPAHCGEFLRPLSKEEVQRVAEDDTSMVHAHYEKASALAESDNEAAWAKERLNFLVQLIQANRDVVVAVGEIGIDYAELTCCPREIQEKYFVEQLRAFAPLQLPFLFHSRECGMNFVSLLQSNRDHLKRLDTSSSEEEGAASPSHPMRGLVHSFNGTREEQHEILSMGLYISLNASAFRQRDLAAQMISIPLDRILLETDAPWCDVRPKDYGAQFVRTTFRTTKRARPLEMGACVERRNEPCHLVQVVEEYVGCANALAAPAPVGGGSRVDETAVVAAVYENCRRLFRL